MDQQHGFPGELPVVPSGWSSQELDLVPGEGFWARIEQIAVKGELTRGFDTVMQGHSSPRIWLFLHEPGRGELSTAAAMSFARELAFRDQAALLLDCDDRDMALTRWAGRVEAEGWIDLARYGTSVLTSGVPMPFVGRRGYLLGVGSFAPTDVTGEEIDTLLTRLRRQADDLLLVAPADSVGRLWAPAANIRVFCWDRQGMSDQEAGAIALDFSEAGCPITALATFRKIGPVEEKLVDDVLSEVKSPPEIREPVAPPDPVVEEPPAVTEAEPVAEDPVPVPEPERRDLPPETETEFADRDLEANSSRDSVRVPERVTGRETSRVFWYGALAAVALIAMATVYYFKFVQVPSDGHFEQINVVTEAEPQVTTGQEMVVQEGDPQTNAVPTAGGDSLAVTLSDDQGDTLGSLAVTVPESEVVAEVEDVVPEEVAPAEAADPATDSMDMSPYQGPVGAKGWALHVYSLPDSPGTAAEVKELDRRGFSSEVKIFDLGEKGRWFRIYVGSFSSRTEAKQAMPALLKKLGEDWAKPERFETSAPE